MSKLSFALTCANFSNISQDIKELSNGRNYWNNNGHVRSGIGREESIIQHNIEDEVKKCIQKYNSVSRCTKELGIDVATVLDIISKIQNKPLLERGHLYG